MIIINGRKAQYPGWELDRFFLPRIVTEPAALEVFAARRTTPSRRSRPTCEGAHHQHPLRGLHARERPPRRASSPREPPSGSRSRYFWKAPRGGVSDQQLWVCSGSRTPAAHAYFVLQLSRRHPRPLHLSARQVLGSGWRQGSDRQREPQPPRRSPTDDKADGTFGRRGTYLVTDAPSVVAELTAIVDADLRRAVHKRFWGVGPGRPDAGRAAQPASMPSYDSGGSSYPVQNPTPLVTQGASPFSSSTHRNRRCAIRTACWGWSTGPAPAIRSWWSSFMRTPTGARRPATWPPIRTHGYRPTSTQRAQRGQGARAARRLLRQSGSEQSAQQLAHGGVSTSVAQGRGISTCRQDGAIRPARASTTRWC